MKTRKILLSYLKTHNLLAIKNSPSYITLKFSLCDRLNEFATWLQENYNNYNDQPNYEGAS